MNIQAAMGEAYFYYIFKIRAKGQMQELLLLHFNRKCHFKHRSDLGQLVVWLI